MAAISARAIKHLGEARLNASTASKEHDFVVTTIFSALTSIESEFYRYQNLAAPHLSLATGVQQLFHLTVCTHVHPEARNVDKQAAGYLLSLLVLALSYLDGQEGFEDAYVATYRLARDDFKVLANGGGTSRSSVTYWWGDVVEGLEGAEMIKGVDEREEDSLSIAVADWELRKAEAAWIAGAGGRADEPVSESLREQREPVEKMWMDAKVLAREDMEE